MFNPLDRMIRHPKPPVCFMRGPSMSFMNPQYNKLGSWVGPITLHHPSPCCTDDSNAHLSHLCCTRTLTAQGTEYGMPIMFLEARTVRLVSISWLDTARDADPRSRCSAVLMENVIWNVRMEARFFIPGSMVPRFWDSRLDHLDGSWRERPLFEHDK